MGVAAKLAKAKGTVLLNKQSWWAFLKLRTAFDLLLKLQIGALEDLRGLKCFKGVWEEV